MLSTSRLLSHLCRQSQLVGGFRNVALANKNRFGFSSDADEFHTSTVERQHQEEDNFTKVLNNNKKWAAEMTAKNPTYFEAMKNEQKPKYFWIGCADSRVPANEVLGLDCGEVFVHRNVANLAPPSDINVQASLQFAV